MTELKNLERAKYPYIKGFFKAAQKFFAPV